VSVWITFLIVILQAEPYVGIRAIEPEILEQVLRQIQ